MRYRWAVLAAGTLSQTSFSALAIGLPVLVPTLREEYDLTLGQIGVVLGAEWIGALVTMLPWGIAADRFGERVVLASASGRALRSWSGLRTPPISARSWRCSRSRAPPGRA